MHDDIDDLIRRAAPTQDAVAEEAFEAEVWRRVNRHHQTAAAMRRQVGVLVLAGLIGALGGGVYARQEQTPTSELRVLTVEAGLDPFGLTGHLG
ncbi:MAG: hypothetical protein J0L52_04035 [Caulobacterales bacterium]|nr:hypothetical protein [Caulobacterales bacterium]